MITSAYNSQVKNVINLIKKSGERKRHGLFVIEGLRMFRETPADLICSVYASESFVRGTADLLCGYRYETVSDEVFGRMSDTRTPQGILATVRMPRYSIDSIVNDTKNTNAFTRAGSTDKTERSAAQPLIVVLENIQDPGNLGTIIRSAEGAGVSGIIMSGDTADIYNPKVVRSTMGSIYRVPFVYVDDICAAVRNLSDRGIRTYAAHLDGAAEYYNVDYRAPSAVLIGNEGNGLSAELTAAADSCVKIPMKGSLESLNAAVSTAVILYEAARQRSLKVP